MWNNSTAAVGSWRWSLDFVGSTNWYYLDLILLPSYTPSSCSNPKYSRHSPRLILSLFERWFEKCSSPRDINWASDNVGHALLENFMTDNYELSNIFWWTYYCLVTTTFLEIFFLQNVEYIYALDVINEELPKLSVDQLVVKIEDITQNW